MKLFILKPNKPNKTLLTLSWSNIAAASGDKKLADIWIVCANASMWPAKFGAISTTFAIAPAYEAVMSVTATNQIIKINVISQPK